MNPYEQGMNQSPLEALQAKRAEVFGKVQVGEATLKDLSEVDQEILNESKKSTKPNSDQVH